MLKTKVPVTVDEYGANYCLIGPLSKKNASLEVEVCEPEDEEMRECLGQMRKAGVQVVFGHWLIDGAPAVLLFDLESSLHRLNEWKAGIWEAAAIPSPSNDQEMNNAIVFGFLVAWFTGLVHDARFAALRFTFSSTSSDAAPSPSLSTTTSGSLRSASC